MYICIVQECRIVIATVVQNEDNKNTSQYISMMSSIFAPPNVALSY